MATGPILNERDWAIVSFSIAAASKRAVLNSRRAVGAVV